MFTSLPARFTYAACVSTRVSGNSASACSTPAVVPPSARASTFLAWGNAASNDAWEISTPVNSGWIFGALYVALTT